MTRTTSADHRHPVAAEAAQRQAQRGPGLVDDALGLVAQTERAEVGLRLGGRDGGGVDQLSQGGSSGRARRT